MGGKTIICMFSENQMFETMLIAESFEQNNLKIIMVLESVMN